MELAQNNRLNPDIVAKEIYEEKYRYPDRKLAERCLIKGCLRRARRRFTALTGQKPSGSLAVFWLLWRS